MEGLVLIILFVLFNCLIYSDAQFYYTVIKIVKNVVFIWGFDGFYRLELWVSV